MDKMAGKIHAHQGVHQEPCRVLLVEDDPDDLLLGRNELETLEDVQEVLCFANGRELVEYMRLHSTDGHPVIASAPTLIVCDLNMPEMDGFEILRQLKPESFFHTIPIIMVSGELSYESVKKAMALKAAAFFRKPLNACDLHSFLQHGRPWPPKDRG